MKARIHIGRISQKIREMRPIADQNFLYTLTEMLNKFMIGFRNLRISKSMSYGEPAPFHHIHMIGWIVKINMSLMKLFLAYSTCFYMKRKNLTKNTSLYLVIQDIKR